MIWLAVLKVTLADVWKMDFREQEQKQALSDAVALVHSFFTGFHPYHSPVREADLAEPPTTNEAETQRRDSQGPCTYIDRHFLSFYQASW